ncbi:MAG: rhomboid family intramembrane serine protease [Luteolibacter sp.]|nr:rhomboid family intramembrane serine protease [Luteolibacter sp.]
MTDTDEETSSNLEQMAEIGNYPTLDQAHEHGLVILAMRQPCMVTPAVTPGQYALHAEAAAAPEIARELDAYENEREITRPAAPLAGETFRHAPGWGVYGIWVLCLLTAFFWQQQDPWLVERAASSSIGLIGHREWWRPFTGLFLHADAPHLIGNLLSGLFFSTLVARSIGAWRAWALILTCGMTGNALTSALTWPASFTSIGASTAVFGALGILSGLGFSFVRRQRLQLPWAKTAAPLLAGIILLGWLGGGSESGNTDVLGHVFGFGSGLTAGIVIGTLSPANAGARV